MKVMTEILSDLRSRRLWPLMAVLVVALVAVPVLLAKSSHTPAQTASVPVPSSPAPTLPTVSSVSAASHAHVSGRSRDPFGGGGGAVTTTASSASSAASTASSASKASSSKSSKSSSSGGGSSSSSSSSSTPTSLTPLPIAPPPASAKKAPKSLGASDVYRVTLAVSYPSGGLNTIDPLERLSVLPSNSQPLLVELGVLRGGRRVLFAVQPGAVVSGPGTCTPGPLDCEVLSLAVGQNENLSSQSASGTNEVALFAVTAISAHNAGSSSAAFQARRHASAAGRAVLESSKQSAVSLFRYQPQLGVVVDLRNLSIGG